MSTHIDDEDRFVEAVAKTTGKKQSIPREWLDHPVLGRNFELPPSARDAATTTETPDATKAPAKTAATADTKEK